MKLTMLLVMVLPSLAWADGGRRVFPAELTASDLPAARDHKPAPMSLVRFAGGTIPDELFVIYDGNRAIHVLRERVELGQMRGRSGLQLGQ